jgi:hypothetical protein
LAEACCAARCQLLQQVGQPGQLRRLHVLPVTKVDRVPEILLSEHAALVVEGVAGDAGELGERLPRQEFEAELQRPPRLQPTVWRAAHVVHDQAAVGEAQLPKRSDASQHVDVLAVAFKAGEGDEWVFEADILVVELVLHGLEE